MMKKLHIHIKQALKAKNQQSETSIFIDLTTIISLIIFYSGVIFTENEKDLKTIHSAIIMISVIRISIFYLDFIHFKNYYKELISKIKAKDFDWDINLNILFLDIIVYLMILLNLVVIVDYSDVKYGAVKIGSGVLAVLIINIYKMVKRRRQERKEKQ